MENRILLAFVVADTNTSEMDIRTRGHERLLAGVMWVDEGLEVGVKTRWRSDSRLSGEVCRLGGDDRVRRHSPHPGLVSMTDLPHPCLDIVVFQA